MNADSLRMSPNPETGNYWLEIARERQEELDKQSMEAKNSDRAKLLTESVHWAEKEAAYHLGATSLQAMHEENFGETA